MIELPFSHDHSHSVPLDTLSLPLMHTCTQYQQCMAVPLHYQEHPPTQGSYRPLAPAVGEYQYLPPQRWLHTLKKGGLALLYHPCVNEEQVDLLRRLSLSCLNDYVLTPYPNLTREEVCYFLLTYHLPACFTSWQ